MGRRSPFKPRNKVFGFSYPWCRSYQPFPRKRAWPPSRVWLGACCASLASPPKGTIPSGEYYRPAPSSSGDSLRRESGALLQYLPSLASPCANHATRCSLLFPIYKIKMTLLYLTGLARTHCCCLADRCAEAVESAFYLVGSLCINARGAAHLTD
nr:unnamed protein product [Homo sapiens]